MRRPNHASRFEGIAKTNLQASRASDTETLQSQVNKAGKKRLSLSGLEILHGRRDSCRLRHAGWSERLPPNRWTAPPWHGRNSRHSAPSIHVTVALIVPIEKIVATMALIATKEVEISLVEYD